MGNLSAAVGRAVNIHDTKAGIKPAKLAAARYPGVKKSCADKGH
jgi:hypothetical protein